jgi:hypothetical protein
LLHFQLLALLNFLSRDSVLFNRPSHSASEFLLHYCHEWHERSKRISLRNPRSAQGHIRNLESEFLKKALKDFFQLAQSNDTKLICSYTDERVRLLLVVFLRMSFFHNSSHDEYRACQSSMQKSIGLSPFDLW